MEFSLSSEQAQIIGTAKRIVEEETYPYEREVEQANTVRRSW